LRSLLPQNTLSLRSRAAASGRRADIDVTLPASVLGIIAAYCAEEVRVFHIPSEYYDKIVDDIGIRDETGITSSNTSNSMPDLPKGLARSNFFESPRQSEEVDLCSDSSTESDAFLL
jgi:hypothetical protein